MDKVFHMVGGKEEASYAKNSSHQRQVLKEVKPILMKCIKELFGNMEYDLPNCIRVADMGCSSGPNVFLTAEHIIECFNKAAQLGKNNDQQEPRLLQYFLNDLFSNDFNLVFKGLHEFYEKLEGRYGEEEFVSKFLIASMVPNGLVTGWVPGNEVSIYCANTSPPEVHQAYLGQFNQDFSSFLRMRSQELVQHGKMLLTFLCKDEKEVEGSHFLHLLGMALSDMVAEGHLNEEKLDSFYVPWYAPSIHETKKIIQNEGSFEIQQIHTFKRHLDASCNDFSTDATSDRATYVATYLRAIHQQILENHFGEDLSMDELFMRFSKKLENILQLGQGFLNSLVISLRKI